MLSVASVVRSGWAHISIRDAEHAALQRALLTREGVRFDASGYVQLRTFGWLPGLPRSRTSHELAVYCAPSTAKPASLRLAHLRERAFARVGKT